jgi:DNA polymerase V
MSAVKLTLAAPVDPSVKDTLRLPLLGSIACGFPSPAGDYEEKDINLQEFLIPRPSSTFLAWSNGTSLIHKGIPSKALLVIDASVEPKHGDVVAAVLDGQLTCKVLDKRSKSLRGDGEEPIEIKGDGIEVFGVVMKAINVLCLR